MLETPTAPTGVGELGSELTREWPNPPPPFPSSTFTATIFCFPLPPPFSFSIFSPPLPNREKNDIREEDGFPDVGDIGDLMVGLVR